MVTTKNIHLHTQFIQQLKLNIEKSFISAISVMLWCVVAFSTFSSYFTGCFEFIVDGNVIGYSTSKSAYTNMLAVVNEEIAKDFNNNAIIEKSAIAVPRIITQKKLTPSQDFHDNIAALSTHMQEAHTLTVNDVPTISFKTQKDLDIAINSFKSQFEQNANSIEINETIGSIPRYVSIANIYSPETAVKYLNNHTVLNVNTTSNEVYAESIDFDILNIDNDSLYQGLTEISQAGELGEKTISADITRINGVETSRTVVSEIITKDAVPQICQIGIKLRPIGVGTGNFLFPTNGTISSRYGSRWGKNHNGIDIANSTGTAIKAADEGVVKFSGIQNGYGNIIIIDHKNGYNTYYGHCSELLKEVGDVVEKGDVIAKMGNTGRSTGPHLHFEIRKDGEIMDPLSYVSQ